MKKAYFMIPDDFIERKTEKAYGVGTTRYNKHEIVWVAKSVVKETPNGIYTPAWLIAKNDLWNYVFKNNKLVLEN